MSDTAKPTNTLTWNDGSNFSGYVRVQMSLPSGFTNAFLNSAYVDQPIPADYILPVQNGVINNNLSVWKTDKIAPFGVEYSWSAYDSTFRRIAGPSALFEVTTDTFSLPALTLTTIVPPPTMPLNTYQYYQFTGGDTYTPDLVNGQIHEIYLNRVTTTINTPVYTGGTLVSGQNLTLIFFRDNAATTITRDVSLSTNYLWSSGSKDESGFLILPSDSDVQNIANFVLQPTGKWLNISWIVGVPRV